MLYDIWHLDSLKVDTTWCLSVFVLRFQQFLEFLIRVMQVLALLYVFNVDNTKYKVCFMEFRRHNEY